MKRQLTALLAVAALVLIGCSDPADIETTTTTAPPTTGEDPGATTSTPEPPTISTPTMFASTKWAVVSFGIDGADQPVLPGAIPTVEFGGDGLQVGGTSGCNSYGGAAVLSSETGITFGEMAWTEMACIGDGVMDQEQRFFTALGRVDGFSLTETGLVFEASDGSAILRLTPVAPAPSLPLAGDWRLVTFIDGETAVSTVAGTELTLTIDLTTATISGNAGCNGYSGGIVLEPSEDLRRAAVLVGPLATTLMACDPDVMDQELEFHSILAEATEIAVEVGFLTVATDDGRALVFEPAGG